MSSKLTATVMAITTVFTTGCFQRFPVTLLVLSLIRFTGLGRLTYPIRRYFPSGFSMVSRLRIWLVWIFIFSPHSRTGLPPGAAFLIPAPRRVIPVVMRCEVSLPTAGGVCSPPAAGCLDYASCGLFTRKTIWVSVVCSQVLSFLRVTRSRGMYPANSRSSPR